MRRMAPELAPEALSRPGFRMRGTLAEMPDRRLEASGMTVFALDRIYHQHIGHRMEIVPD